MKQFNLCCFASPKNSSEATVDDGISRTSRGVLSWGRPSGRPFSASWVLFLGLMSLLVQMKQRLTLTLELTPTVLELHQPRCKLAISSWSFHSLCHNYTPGIPHHCVSTIQDRTSPHQLMTIHNKDNQILFWKVRCDWKATTNSF